MIVDSDDYLYAGTRARWLAGRCLCCGGELCPWPSPDGSMIEPEAIGEGVIMCGRCIGNNHHTDPDGFAESLLAALVPK